jgi:hypothetical protein
MDCHSARQDDGQCGPRAHHFAARRYPYWLWPIGSIIIGSMIAAGFCLLLVVLFQHGLPARATRAVFWRGRDHDRQNAYTMRRQKQLVYANYAYLTDETALKLSGPNLQAAGQR